MRLFIVDEHVLFRRCMMAYLKANDHIIIVGETNSPEMIFEMLQQETKAPDLILVDMDFSNESNVKAINAIRDSAGKPAIVFLSELTGENQLLQAINLGASGYLGKDIEPETLVDALYRISTGEKIFPQHLPIQKNHEVCDRLQLKAKRGNEINLTKRELEVLQQVTFGLMDKQIAEKLLVSENTVKNHMKSIRKKFGVSNRLQATLAGIELGVTQPGIAT